MTTEDRETGAEAQGRQGAPDAGAASEGPGERTPPAHTGILGSSLQNCTSAVLSSRPVTFVRAAPGRGHARCHPRP